MLKNELDEIIEVYYSNTSSYKTINSKVIELTKVFHKKSLRKFTQKDIAKFIIYLKNNNNKPSTINSKLAFLSKALSYYRNNLVIPYQKVIQKDKDIVTNEQYNVLLDKFKDNRELLNIIKIAYNTGLRINEILKLTSKDIKLINNVYYLNISETKNNFNNLIPTMGLDDILKDFTNFTLNYKQVYYQLKLNGVNPHLFRHTFITNCYLKGLDSFTIMKLTNQRSLSVNQRYCHLSNVDLANKLSLLK